MKKIMNKMIAKTMKHFETMEKPFLDFSLDTVPSRRRLPFISDAF